MILVLQVKFDCFADGIKIDSNKKYFYFYDITDQNTGLFRLLGAIT